MDRKGDIGRSTFILLFVVVFCLVIAANANPDKYLAFGTYLSDSYDGYLVHTDGAFIEVNDYSLICHDGVDTTIFEYDPNFNFCFIGECDTADVTFCNGAIVNYYFDSKARAIELLWEVPGVASSITLDGLFLEPYATSIVDGRIIYTAEDYIDYDRVVDFKPYVAPDAYAINGVDGASDPVFSSQAIPVIGSLDIQSSLLRNSSGEYLLAINGSITDADGNATTIVYDWRENDTSIALANFPMTCMKNSSKLKDYSSFENNATRNGTFSCNISDGISSSGAWHFDGVSDWFEIEGNPSELRLIDNFTIATWVYHVGTGSQDIIISDMAASPQYSWALYWSSSNKWTFGYSTDGTVFSTGVSSAANQGEWTHVVGVKTDTGVQLYINGVLRDSASGVDNFFNGNGDLRIGAYDISGIELPWQGMIDSILIFNRSFSAAEIRAMNATGPLWKRLPAADTNPDSNYTLYATASDGSDESTVSIAEMDIIGFNSSLVRNLTKLIYDDFSTPFLDTNWTSDLSTQFGTSINLTKDGQGHIYAAANTFAHIEYDNVDQLDDFFAQIFVNTSGNAGESWAPGIALYWSIGNWTGLYLDGTNGDEIRGQVAIDSALTTNTAVVTADDYYLGIRLTQSSILFLYRLETDSSWTVMQTLSRPAEFADPPSKFIVGKGYGAAPSYSNPDLDNDFATPGAFTSVYVDDFSVTQNETINLGLRKFPYPYVAGFSLATDIDGTNVEEFLQLRQFLTTKENTSQNVFNKTGTDMGIGVGLEIEDSFWMYSMNSYNGYDGIDDVGAMTYFQDNTTILSNDSGIIKAFGQAGQLGFMHSFGSFDNFRGFARALALHAKDEMDRLNMSKKTWINHGMANFNYQNMGLLWYFKGDNPNDAEYHSDQTLYPNGSIRFLWRGNTTNTVGYEPLMSYVVLNDSRKVHTFTRFKGVAATPHVEHIDLQLSAANLGTLVSKQGYMVNYNHIGYSSEVGTNDAIPVFDANNTAAFRDLAAYHENGSIYVTTTDKLLWYRLMYDYLTWNQTGNCAAGVLINITNVSDPIMGHYVPTFEDLQGITFYSECPEKVIVYLADVNVTARMQINSQDSANFSSIMFPIIRNPAMPEWTCSNYTFTTQEYNISIYNYTINITNIDNESRSFPSTLTYFGLHSFNISYAMIDGLYQIYIPDWKRIGVPYLSAGEKVTLDVVNGNYNFSLLPRLFNVSGGVEVYNATYNLSTQTTRVFVNGSGANKSLLFTYNITDRFLVKDNGTIVARFVNRTLNWSENLYTMAYNTATSDLNITIPSMSYHEILIQNFPVITAIAPSNATISASASFDFNFSVAADNPIANCSLVINNVINRTLYTIVRDMVTNFSTVEFVTGNYNWTINCTDNNSNMEASELRELIVDRLGPNILQTSPNAGTYFNQSTISFFINATDNLGGDLNCSLLLNGTAAQTNSSVNQQTQTNFIASLSEGYHAWSVKCIDSLSNFNVSQNISFTADFNPPLISNITFLPDASGSAGTYFNLTLFAKDIANVSSVIGYLQSPDENTNLTFNFTVGDNNDGTFNYTWNSTGYPEGLYYIDVNATDGNSRSKERENQFVISIASNVNATYINNSIDMLANQSTFVNQSNTDVGAEIEITTINNVTDTSVNLIRYSSNPTNAVAGSRIAVNEYTRVIVENRTNGNLSSALVKLYYSQSLVNSLNIDESTLRLYHYNESEAIWELLAPGGVNQGENYVWGNTTSFSLFGVFGDGVQSSPPSSTSVSFGFSGESGGAGAGFIEPIIVEEEEEIESGVKPLDESPNTILTTPREQGDGAAAQTLEQISTQQEIESVDKYSTSTNIIFWGILFIIGLIVFLLLYKYFKSKYI